MPPFPSAIQDLIRKMLTVDPSKRITIDDIKAHPAFRAGLSPLYVVPSPIPFPSLSPAVDPSSLSRDVLDVLSHIGFSSDELSAQLKSADPTPAKVFLSMVNRTLDLESLPWEHAHSGPPQPADGATPVDAASDIGGNRIGNRTFAAGRPRMVPVSPSEAYSLAARPEWALGEAPVSEVLGEMQVEVSGQTTWSIFARAQAALGVAQCRWLHPDPVTMLVRSSGGSLYMSLVGKCCSAKDVKITALLHKGENNEFNELVSMLFDAILDKDEQTKE